MDKKELRKLLKDFLNENQIEFDPSLNTKNLYAFGVKNGFVLENENSEETDEQREEYYNNLGNDENIEETGNENIEETGNENIEETNIEEIETKNIQEPQPKRPVIKQPKKESPNPVLNPMPNKPNNLDEPKPEINETGKKDNSWVWAMVALIVVAALYMFIKKRNEND